MTSSVSEPTSEALPPPVAPVPPRPRRRLLEWIWRGRALAEAERALPEVDARQRERTLRARAALELADRTLDPVDELKAGRGTPLACSLYREAIYWALLADDATYEAPDLVTAFALVPRTRLLAVAGGEVALAEVEEAAGKPSLQTWQDSEQAQEQAARQLQRFSRALLQTQAAPQQLLARLLLQRTVRTFLAVFVLALFIGGAVLLLRPKHGPDLAAGKPWKASSTFAVCNPQNKECGGSRTVIFFCTQEEQNPWMEIDLGQALEISRVEVQNRTDCCDERAVPLAIEVSQDGKNWREVARKTELFSLWNANFGRTKARYVRTRALARTFLHLERVSVRAN